MKRSLLVLLCIALLFFTAACGSTGTEEPTDTGQTVVETITMEAVSIPSSSGSYDIPAIVTMPAGDGPFPFVVMCHGWAGNKDEGHGFGFIARQLALEGVGTIRMDFNGTGDSTVDFVEFCNTTSVKDVNDCLDYCLENYPIDAEQLGIFGYSNGGRIAAMITAQENPYKVRVMLAPYIYATSTAEELEDHIKTCEEQGYVEREWYGRTLKVGKQDYLDDKAFNENLDAYLVPGVVTLVICGSEDEAILTENSIAYAQAIQAHYLVVQGANHGYGMYGNDDASNEILDTVAGAVASFFRLHLTTENAQHEFAQQ